jgi:hypothetical protein
MLLIYNLSMLKKIQLDVLQYWIKGRKLLSSRQKNGAKIADLLDNSMLIFQNYLVETTIGNLYCFLSPL